MNRRDATLWMFALAGVAWMRSSRAHSLPPAPAIGAFTLPEPLPLAVPHGLTDQLGRRFDAARLQGAWTLLTFGFTRCPDVCPTALAQMQQARKRLTERAPRIVQQSVFVSIDPAHDSTDAIAKFVGNFGEGLAGVRGQRPAVDRFAAPFKVRYAAATGAASGLFDHTASVSLIDPAARLRVVFALPLDAQRVADTVASLNAQDNARSAR
jgi:protein SCO1